MSENRTSIKGCWRLNAAPRWYFTTHNPLDRRKIQLAKRIVLTTEETLSFSTVLDRFGPDVHHLAAYERLDPF